MRCYWQVERRVNAVAGVRELVSAETAAVMLAAGWSLRLLDEADVVYGFVSRELACARALIKSDCRLRGVVVPRALAALLFQRLGWSVSAIGAELNMAKSSVHEMMDKYRGHRSVRTALGRAGAFGKSGVRVLGGAA